MISQWMTQRQSDDVEITHRKDKDKHKLKPEGWGGGGEELLSDPEESSWCLEEDDFGSFMYSASIS